MQLNSVELAIFGSRLNAICEEMGFALQRSALSPNIKDRLDFSCAIFDVDGHICAQAAHIPVHLGSMAFAMRDIVSGVPWSPGDMLVMNDPFLGGTHLPDVTLIAPVFVLDAHVGFVANRAHHANIGSASPGSMPLSTSLDQEGVVIEPVKLIEAGTYADAVVQKLASIEGSVDAGANAELPGDFYAQVSANLIGSRRLQEWVTGLSLGVEQFVAGIQCLNEYGRELARTTLATLPSGASRFEDYLDSDGFADGAVKIALELRVDEGRFELDFSGTDGQVKGNINCPLSVCMASVYYVFACLLPDYVPCCQGAFDCLTVRAPEGSVVNASRGSAVAAGNVETSMRIVDVVIGALTRLGVDMPAASQGTMNNIAMGAASPEKRWDYYETIGGGEGGHSQSDGRSGVHTHMTNTLNTPVESLELHYPLRVEAYALRHGSGGEGLYCGGAGILRSYRFLEHASVTLLTDRRLNPPWGAYGGAAGAVGMNMLNGHPLPGKSVVSVQSGDVLSVLTPGGGGWGNKDSSSNWRQSKPDSLN